MASRPSPNSLIHCAVCGEDYSATYRRCPFCGAKNAPSAPQPSRSPAPPAPEREPAPPDPDDTYVFDGQDLFDDEYEEDYRPARPKGGKRLQEKPSSNPFANADINWPRLITFLCSLIIIVAALVIVFTVIYPQLRGDKDSASITSEQPSPGVTDPVGANTQPVDPNVTDPVQAVTDPVTDPAITQQPVDPNVGELTDIKLNSYDFTLYPGEKFQLVATFTPADWSGPVTWTSTNEDVAMVSPEGLVTHADPNVTRLHHVVITATAGGKSVECDVYIAAGSNAQSSQPPASDPPATQAPSSGGNPTVGKTGTIVGADGGLNVRPDPSTSNPPIASLQNGNTVNVIEDAGGGWYKITFSGSGGAATEGYIKGEYISTN